MFFLADARIIAQQTVKRLAVSQGLNASAFSTSKIHYPDVLYQPILDLDQKLLSQSQIPPKTCISDPSQIWRCNSAPRGTAGPVCNTSSSLVHRCAVDETGVITEMQVSFLQAVQYGTFNRTQCQYNFMFLCAAFGGTLLHTDLYDRCNPATLCLSTFVDEVRRHRHRCSRHRRRFAATLALNPVAPPSQCTDDVDCAVRQETSPSPNVRCAAAPLSAPAAGRPLSAAVAGSPCAEPVADLREVAPPPRSRRGPEPIDGGARRAGASLLGIRARGEFTRARTHTLRPRYTHVKTQSLSFFSQSHPYTTGYTRVRAFVSDRWVCELCVCEGMGLCVCV